MPSLIAQTKLNASTIDILNVIRANASAEYQDKVPVVNEIDDIVKVGQIIYGTPAFSNQFINVLVNRIALVLVNSATFNNPYKMLKKGQIDFGETIEDIFVGIAQVVEYDPAKAESREFARTFPDVKAAFYKLNWRVMYPVTIQDQDLYMAFQSADGVQSLITKIINSIMVAYEYDEFLLFKYQLIKAIAHGKMYPVAVDGSDLKNYAEKFKAYRNKIKFMKSEYNEAGVKNNTEDSNICIFLDSDFDASFDVNVLASAFNMEKADFMGRRFLIDDWTTFDNERWNIIRENTINSLGGSTEGVVEEVTAEELELMKDVHGILIDEKWFQIYENRNIMKEKEVASGLYWNYFYHNWKTIAHSPFANALVFVDNTATLTYPANITVTVTDVSTVGTATVVNVECDDTANSFVPTDVHFVQTEAMTEDGVAVQRYGSFIVPKTKLTESYDVEATLKSNNYKATGVGVGGLAVGDTFTLAKQ